MNRKASGIIDHWLTLGELAKLFGLGEESIKRLRGCAALQSA